jgi:hypothetical protein
VWRGYLARLMLGHWRVCGNGPGMAVNSAEDSAEVRGSLGCAVVKRPSRSLQTTSEAWETAAVGGVDCSKRWWWWLRGWEVRCWVWAMEEGI